MKRLDKLKEDYNRAKYLLTLEGNEEWDKFCEQKFIEVTNRVYLTLEILTYIAAIIVFSKILYDTFV
tara:strand:+ start:683 stop:883 length:201 start_codon:yes stop_codon:yes gene_type:complete